MIRRALPFVLAVVAGVAASLPASADVPPPVPPEPPPWWWRRPPPPPPPIEEVAPVPVQFHVELVDAASRPLPVFFFRGDRWVMGMLGQRYRVHIHNPTAARVEAVVSVDGLDAVDGRTASYAKRGYVLPPFGQITIDGFRTSLDTVAAFRFSSVRDSYAARKGQDRNVGVIGVAFFRERPPIAVARPRPSPPWWGGRDGASGGAAAPSNRGAAPAPATEAPRKERAGIGTAFGEQRESRVSETTFERESARPFSVVQIRYDDRDGLRAMGIRIPPEPREREDEGRLREGADPFPGSRRFATPPP
jgi:hypothetical protein